MTGSVPAGFLLIDKPSGWTSHDVVAKLRGLLRVKKVGHAGTLDPMATGLVVVGIQRATRLLRFVQSAPKEYVATSVFGVTTDSLDADGAILERTPMDVTESELRKVMERFVGTIAQIPPMVSARKIGGKRLYELAREGVEVEREARDVEIYSLDLLEFAPQRYPEVTFRTVCSTGTYVRTLADDMARALGGGAHLSALRRIRNGSLHVRDALSIGDAENAAVDGTIVDMMLSPRQGLPDLPEVEVSHDVGAGVRNGLAFPASGIGTDDTDAGPIRLVDGMGELLAVYRIADGRATPEVVLA